MAETLLWPKKLNKPPELLVDVTAMFTGKNGSNAAIPVIGSSGTSDTVKYRLIDVSSDGSNTFRIGFIKKLSRSAGGAIVRTAMPFQMITAAIDEYRCHGWTTSSANLLSTPSQTEVSKTVSGNSSISVPIYIPPSSEHKSLFKMLSPEFEGGSFSSLGRYAGIDCSISYNMMDAQNDFPDMFNNYSNGMMAIEIVVIAKVFPSISKEFAVGIV